MEHNKPLDLAQIWADVVRGLRTGFMPLLAYGVLFKIVAAAAFTPLVAALLNALISTTGQLSVTNAEIAAFLLSATGISTLVAMATTALVLIFAEQAGLVMIGFAAEHDQRLKPLRALQLMLVKLPKLLSVALLQVLIVLGCALPFLGVAALTYILLLSGHDINYYLAERPPVFRFTLVIAALLLLGLGVVLAVLFVRWVVALPVCLFEGKGFAAALRGSRELVRGNAAPVALLALGWVALMLLLSTVAVWILREFSELVLTLIPENSQVVVVTVASLMALFTLQTVVLSFVGSISYSLLVVRLYEQLAELKVQALADRLEQLIKEEPSAAQAGLKWRWSVVWLVVGVFGAVTVGTAYALMENLDLQDRVQVTAHRGSSYHAPENSLSAIRRAIEDGADYAEIDVQETADGVIVVIHDSDLMRVAGLNKKLWDLNYGEIKDLDAGSWFSSKFKGEPIPTLEQAIELARGKIKLNIELKFNGHEQQLPERVVQIIEDQDFVDHCVLTSLEYPGLQRVKQLNDKLKIGHIVSVAVGDMTRLEVDFLSLKDSLATDSTMHAARRQGLGVHVWTVNVPRVMAKMIDKGVENIITDRPAVLAALLKERSELSDTELMLLKFRHFYMF